MCCISTVKFSILINGSPLDFFGSSRGLSSLFFDIVMEAWSRMLDMAVVARQFSGFCVGFRPSNSMMVSHLLFVDDTLIFCVVDPNQLVTLREILTRFKEVLGLRINLGKSKLVTIGEVHNLDVLVGLLGCRLLPFEIFGTSFGR